MATFSDTEKQDRFLLLHALSIKANLFAFCLMLLSVVIDKLRTFQHLATHFYGGSSRDAGLYYWLSLENKNLFTSPWFSTHVFYPYGGSLAWSDNFILPSLAHTALTSMGFASLSAYNLVLFTALFLNGYCTFRLAYSISGAYFAALISGLSFYFLSYFSHHAGHPQLLFAFWIPLGVASLFHYLASLKKRWIILSWLCVVGSFLCSVYYAIFLALLLPLTLLAVYLVKPHYFGRRQIQDSCLGIVVSGFTLLPFLLPYLQTKKVFGARFIYESFFYAATSASYLTAANTNFLYASISNSWSHDEAKLFVGFTLLFFLFAAYLRLVRARPLQRIGLWNGLLVGLLFICGFFAHTNALLGYGTALLAWASIFSFAYLLRRLGAAEKAKDYFLFSNRCYLAVFIFLGLVFFCLSLGPLGNAALDQYTLGPFAFFFYLLPGFNAIRATGRLAIVSLWILCLLLPFILGIIAKKKSWGVWFYGLVTLLIIVENIAQTYPLEEGVWAPDAYYHLADQLSEHDAVIVLPLSPKGTPQNLDLDIAAYANFTVNVMRWATMGQYKLVNGYSGQIPVLHKNLMPALQHFPDTKSLNALAMIANLEKIVVHSALLENFDATTFEKQIADSAVLTVQEKDAAGVYVLQYEPRTKISEGYHLLIPSNQHGELQLEIELSKETQALENTISLYNDNSQDTAAFATFKLNNKGMQEHTITVPLMGNGMRPLRISFHIDQASEMYLRERKFLSSMHH